MNEKTAQQIAKMKEQTIGVEVEMNHITREKSAKIAAEFFGTNRSEYTANRNGYYTWSAWGRTGQRVEISKRCKHQRTRQRKVRNGHTDFEIRGH